uniref:SEFIR domain-containing protein n=1 Tax=Ditylenchus dipsaci TaxID=166011 RepID=A0A915DX23_9BILA
MTHFSEMVVTFSTQSSRRFKDSFVHQEVFRDFLAAYALETDEEETDSSNWIGFRAKNIPKQDNGYDCGAFICQFAERISRVNLVIIVIALLAVLFYLRVWRPWQLARLPPESIELTAKPTVLLLYTDDCEEHSNAVMALANLLTQNANAKVLIDQTDLVDPSIRPSVWLLNSVAEAEFILMLFSKGSKQVINGKILSQRRPFPDLFNTALGYVVAKINDLGSTSASANLNRRQLLANGNPSNAGGTSSTPLLNIEKGALKSQLSRFIVARFAYSSEDVIPEFFAHNRFGKFVIPQDIGLLIGRVHGVVGNRSSNFEYTADLGSLNSTIETFENFNKENSDWLEQRLEKMVTTDSSSQEEQEEIDGKRGGKHRLTDHLERLTSRRTDMIPTLEEQVCWLRNLGC